jgi:hypothetical protein
MGASRSTYVKNEKRITFSSENLKGRDHSEDVRVDVRIILEWILEKYGAKLWNGLFLAQDRNQWRILVNKVMNFRVP